MKKNSLYLNDFADEAFKSNRSGVTYRCIKKNDCKVTKVFVKKRSAEYNKEVGNYVTIECKNDHGNEKTIAKYLKEILVLNGYDKKKKILVVGLGNDAYLSDALGPIVIKSINVTSHLANPKYTSVSCFIPSVMAITGLESSLLIKSVIKQFKIDIVIVIDSLATREISRLYKTYQITDTGINPGSGINNRRIPVNKKVLKVPVIALGVATVVDVLSIMINTLKYLDSKLVDQKIISKIYSHINKTKENFIMTTKEIDSLIDVIALNIAQAINICTNKDLTNYDKS